MIRLPDYLQIRVTATRKKILHAIELASKNSKINLQDADISAGFSVHIRQSGIFTALPKAKRSDKAEFELTADFRDSLAALDLYMDQYALRLLNGQKLAAKANESEYQPSPGGRLVKLMDTRHWARSNTYAMPRCHSSLGGNSTAYYG